MRTELCSVAVSVSVFAKATEAIRYQSSPYQGAASLRTELRTV